MKKDETGEFLHYFMRSVKYKVQEARTREIREDDESVPFDGTAEDDGSPAGREASKLPGPDEETDSLMELETLFDAIEKEFRKKQDRVRPYLSALISVRLYDAIKQFGFRKRYTFMNMPIIRDAMKNRGRVPSQKETAALFNRLEEDASRAINTFFTRLQQDPAVKKLAISKKINPCGT
ncbi:MAG: hypothetical protein LBR93_05355 [Treponema sp.]|nr:hypothetical protein [Treponema sp.]